MDSYGAEDGGGLAREIPDFIGSEIAKWSKVVKEGNVRME